MKKILTCIALTLGMLGTTLATSTAHAVVKVYEDDCTIWMGNPYKVRNTVYASSNIVCDNSKKSIANSHVLTQNSRFWAWKTKASSYAKLENARRNYLRTRYTCNGATATHNWRGSALFTIKKDDGWFGTNTERVTGHKISLTCN